MKTVLNEYNPKKKIKNMEHLIVTNAIANEVMRVR